MDGAYDENLSENPFFIELKKEFPSLFQHVISHSWIICIPRLGSLCTRLYSIQDFCAHILVPNDELPETHYSTLTEKQVTIVNKVVSLEVTKGLPLQSHILFEETFYTEDYIKFRVWCIEKPLDPNSCNVDTTASEYLTNINDCIDLLWTQAAGRHILDNIEEAVHAFLKKHPKIPIALSPLKNAIGELYTNCLQITLQNRRLREKSKASKQVLDNIKTSVECYMQHLLFNSIFKSICTSCSYEDSHLNKKIRNLSDLQLRDLDIRKDLYHNLPRAKQILSKLHSYSTVLEKVLCIKRTLNAINYKESENNTVLLTADDMLPVFVFLIIKSNLPNWYSQLTYMKEFSFSGSANGDGDESSFLITTLEAVIQHIQSGALAGPPLPEAYYYESESNEDANNIPKRKNSNTESISTSDTTTGEETLEYIFDLIKGSNTEQVKAILERNQRHLIEIERNATNVTELSHEAQELFEADDDTDTDEKQQLCHPLCNCKKCIRKLSKKLLKTSPTVMSRDSHGLTPLHIAAIHGKASIVEALLEIGAYVDATDLNECTPLHYAATRGYQNALLLLLHSGANINRVNGEKNTPLHLSVNNGHLNCVKALIYFAEQSRRKINVNCANQKGNTPLHLASKWGYEGIAKLLIENGAEPSLQNVQNKTSFDYAHNLKILNVLKLCSPNLYEYIHITSSSIDSIKCKMNFEKSKKLDEFSLKSDNTFKAVDDLKRIDRVVKAISYGDVKLACFYMNINYTAYQESLNKNNGIPCHPLCNCMGCKKVLETSSEIDVNSSDSHGFTALHYASQYGLDELCSILIMNRADVNAITKKGQTPLHVAALSNKASVVRLLLDSGANINAIDCAGNTAIHLVCLMGNIGAAKVLISYNPDVSIANSSDQTPLDIAKEKVYLTIIDVINTYIKNNVGLGFK